MCETIKEFLARPDIQEIRDRHTHGELMSEDFFRDPFRPMFSNPGLMYAPADGIVLYAKENVKPIDFLDIKGKDFSLKEMLADEAYEEPSLVVGIFMCYSDDTEVFTNGGWKLFSDLSGNEKILTRKYDGTSEWQPIIGLQKYVFAGNLVNLKNRNVDLLVTPNHKIPIIPTAGYKFKPKDYGFDLAKNISRTKHRRYGMPITFNWRGEERDVFVLPPVMIDNYKREKPPLSIPMKDWVAFLGLYLSDGSCSKNNKTFRVIISQKNGSNCKIIEDALNKMPFNCYADRAKDGNCNYLIDNKQLCKYLVHFGKAADKFIPNEIKNLDRKYLEVLLRYLHLGDGWEGNGCCQYVTASPRLAEDVAEIVFKCGKRANVVRRPKTAEKNETYCVVTGSTNYAIFNNISKSDIPYDGYVYDLTVPETHVIWVRRNGKCVWSSNSYLDVHINRVPANCFYLDTRETNQIVTHGVSMLMMENELLEDFHLEPKALDYLVHNEKQASIFYCPVIKGRFYIVQVADKDVDVILNWGKGKFVYQGDRFGQIRHGSQCDLIIPRKKGIDYEILVKPLDHVEAGIDPVLRIKS